MRPLALLLAGAALAGCAAKAPGVEAREGVSPAPASLPAVTSERHTVNGVGYQDIRVGTGAAVEPGQCVYVHYTGWIAATGRRFESSRDTVAGIAGRPLAFPQGAGVVIAGWERGVLGMRLGGQRRLFVPHRLAYGTRGSPPNIPPSAALIFDMEVVALARAGARPSVGAPPRCPPWTG